MKISKIIGLFVLCGLLAGTAPDAAAQEPTPTPPKEWQVRGVLSALNDELPGVQLLAVKKAVELGMADQIPDKDIPKIIALLGYKESSVGYKGSCDSIIIVLDGEPFYNPVSFLLGKFRKRAIPYLPELLRLATDQNSVAQLPAITALRELGVDAKDAVPTLIPLLASKEADIQTVTAQALGSIGEPAQDAVPELVNLLLPVNNNQVRISAALALLHIGQYMQEALQEIVNNSDQNSLDDSLWREVGKLLENKGTFLQEIMPSIISLLADESPNIFRLKGIFLLRYIGEPAQMAAPELVRLLSDKDDYVRFSAATALLNIGQHKTESIEEIVKFILRLKSSWDYQLFDSALFLMNESSLQLLSIQLIPLLSHENTSVLITTIRLLGRISEPAKEAVPALIRLLDSRVRSSTVRSSAAAALGNIGAPAQEIVPELIKLLADEDLNVRSVAATALGNIGAPAQEAVPVLIPLLADQVFRRAAIEALGNIGAPAQEIVSALIPLLADPDWQVRQTATKALSNIGEPANPAVPELLRLLSNEDSTIRETAAQAVGQIGAGDSPMLSVMPFILEWIYAERAVRVERRFLAHFLGASDAEGERLLLWLGKPASSPVTLTDDEARETLRVFKEFWEYTQDFPETRADLAEQIVVVATRYNIFWTQTDLPRLQKLLADLESVQSTNAEALRREIIKIEGRKWGVLALQLLGVHLSLWLVLLLLYPHSTPVQALLWQPLFRNLAGCGYIPLLLTTIPFLKRYLFRPFRKVLLAEAALERFDAARYFAEAEVAPPGLAAPQPLREAIPRLRGQSVLEGESGLGKTMFLRALLRRSRRPAVFLPAEKCVAGMVEAIHAKLPEHLRDRRFLQKLVGGGALDICVDGLNEVSVDTRAAITQFVERAFTGNALLTTQPLEWQPPSTARVFALLPLRRDRIADYLLSRYALFAASAVAAQADYERACRAYLEKELAASQPPELLASTLRILANPMDAVLVVQMLAHGQTPNLFRLQEQQCALMADDYARRHIGRTFPLAEFAERVYQMRLQDRAALPFDDFPDEIACMERHKMAVRRRATERTRPNAAVPTAFETRRLPFELNERIVKFLTDIPGIQAQAAQQAFVAGLRFDARLQGQISANCPPLQFFKTLVPLLIGYGQLDDGRDPLEAALRGAKEYLGKDRQADCDMLIKELRQIAVAAPPRRSAPSPESPSELWYFRHEKIMDYFLVQTFLGAPNERPRKHVSDSRFRGVYFQLAALLPLDEARALREMLIQYAADTKDHTVSDTFIQLLRPREMLSR